ncbi:hypothetical protein ACN47E_005987 [Coniothyrium glycines]
MSSFLSNPLARTARPGAAWANVGCVDSYPDVDDGSSVGQQRLCGGKHVAGCRVFHVPRTDGSKATEIAIDDWKDPEAGGDAKDQVMVFRYKGQLVAINHECPHSSFPLSRGVPFDVEDFGVVLSAGISCPKHGWSFDLHTGRADRGSYRLQVWELQERPGTRGEGSRDVWVRRKQKMG